MEAHELDSSEVHLLEQLVSDFSDRCRRGEEPEVDAYVERHPHLEGPLRDLLGAMKILGGLTPVEPLRHRAPVAVHVPQTIGDYRIVCEIGRGGMGIVYHAVQQSLNRPVALKVLPQSTLQDETSRQRFVREASIAAHLHHTNIVPVFETGRSGDLNYYAMQFIEGTSLDCVIASLRELAPRLDVAYRWKMPPTDYSDQSSTVAHRLLDGRLAEPQAETATVPTMPSLAPSTRPADSIVQSATSAGNYHAAGYCACVARIGIQAASALAHAHAYGVLHRDIKPSNLIIDGAGTIWMTDFGLARQDNQAGLTSAGDLVGTLRYLAPERFRGQFDARADVYSLGLTLYELLTFRSPFDERNRQRLVRQILETEPPAPRKLRPGIPRDLETIVLKAIAKEPEHRYPTAAALGSDLQRFVEGRPVSARPLGPAARTWRWCRRNRTVAGLAASLLFVLLTGLTVVTWQWRRAENNLVLAVAMQHEAAANLVEAERNFLRARQAVDDYLTTISENELLDVPTLEPVRADLLSRAKSFYEDFLDRRGDDPQLKAELAATYIRLSQVTHDLNGDWLPYYERGVTILEQLGSQDAEFTDFRSWREGLYASRAGWLNSDNPDQALAITERAIAIWRRLAAEHPTIQGFRSDLAGLLLVRGMAHLIEKRADPALDDFQASRELRQTLVSESPDRKRFQFGLAESYTMIGIVHLQQNDLDEALECTQRARDLFDGVSQGPTSGTRVADLQATVYQWIAAIRLRQGDPLGALADFRRGISLQERLSREYPYATRYQTNLANSYERLGVALFDARQDKEAQAAFEQCFQLLEERLDDYPEVTEYRRLLSRTRIAWGVRLSARRKNQQAESLFRQAIAALDPDDPADHTTLALAEFRLGGVLRAGRRLADAEQHYAAAIALQRSAADGSPTTLAWYLSHYGDLLERLSKFEEAAAAFSEMLALRRDSEQDSAEVGISCLRLAAVQEKLGLPEAAEQGYRDALDCLRANLPDEHTDVTNAVDKLVGLLRRQSRNADAEQVLANHRAERAKRFGVEFGGGWSIATYDLAGTVDKNSERLLEQSIEGEPKAFLDAPAVDFRWLDGAPQPDLPDEGFALVAQGSLELAPGRYEIQLDAPPGARLTSGERVVLIAGDDATQRPSRAEIAIDAADLLPIRVELLQREPATRLRLWIRRLDP